MELTYFRNVQIQVEICPQVNLEQTIGEERLLLVCHEGILLHIRVAMLQGRYFDIRYVAVNQDYF